MTHTIFLFPNVVLLLFFFFRVIKNIIGQWLTTMVVGDPLIGGAKRIDEKKKVEKILLHGMTKIEQNKYQLERKLLTKIKDQKVNDLIKQVEQELLDKQDKRRRTRMKKTAAEQKKKRRNGGGGGDGDGGDDANPNEDERPETPPLNPLFGIDTDYCVNSCMIECLEPGITYCYRIRAFNDVGWSQWSIQCAKDLM